MATATKVKNPWGKTRPKANPYAIYRNTEGWEWRVLKAYQNPAKELNNRFARWHCFVTTPMCPAGEYGDVYVNEIVGHAHLVGAGQVEGARPTCQSYKAEVIADGSGEWVGNGLRFATREAAKAYAIDLHSRWTAVREWRVVESTDPVNR
jgi:hypothetical protein